MATVTIGPAHLAFVALLVACGAEDSELDALVAIAKDELVPPTPFLTVRHARDLIETVRLSRASDS